MMPLQKIMNIGKIRLGLTPMKKHFSCHTGYSVDRYDRYLSKLIYKITSWGYSLGVYVRPDWHGKRISENLVRECLGWAKEQQITIVKLAAVTNNIPAVRCYERCGFTIYGREPKAIYSDGVYYEEYLMACEI